MSNIKHVNVISHKDEVLKATDEAIEKALTYVGIEWQGAASAMGPVVTGRLMASLNYVTSTGKGEPTRDKLKEGGKLESDDYTPRSSPPKHTVVLGTNVEYGEKIEEGGAKEERHSHFIRNSLNNNKEQFKHIIEEELASL